MVHYVGLNVSRMLTSICIVDRTGKIEREAMRPIFRKYCHCHVLVLDLNAKLGLQRGPAADQSRSST
jgi:hypothetical protein